MFCSKRANENMPSDIHVRYRVTILYGIDCNTKYTFLVCNRIWLIMSQICFNTIFYFQLNTRVEFPFKWVHFKHTTDQFA